MLSICQNVKTDIGPLLHYTAEKSEKLPLIEGWLTTRQSDYCVARSQQCCGFEVWKQIHMMLFRGLGTHHAKLVTSLGNYERIMRRISANKTICDTPSRIDKEHVPIEIRR
jgi:hypothetical protein